MRDLKAFQIALPLHRKAQAAFGADHYPTLCRLLFRKLHDPRTQALIQLLLASGGAVYRTPLAAGAGARAVSCG